MTKSLISLLGKVTKKQTIVLMLDSIDQLMPAYNAYRMQWLPDKLPSKVKIIISTIPEGTYINLQFESVFVESNRLNHDLQD